MAAFARAGFPIWASVVVSSVLFGAAHLYQGRGGLIGTGILGLLFGAFRAFTGSFVPVAVWHAAIDVVAGIAGPRYLIHNKSCYVQRSQRFIILYREADRSVYVPCSSSPSFIRHDSPRSMRNLRWPLTDDQIEQIQRYMALLLKWNDAMNLTAIHDPLEILYRHFCESMFGASFLPVGGGRLADVGSGRRVPGIAAENCAARLEVCLIDSNVKKATFLAEVVRELALPGARVSCEPIRRTRRRNCTARYCVFAGSRRIFAISGWAASERIGARTVMLWIGGRDLDEARVSKDWNWQEPVAVPQSLDGLSWSEVAAEQEPVA